MLWDNRVNFYERVEWDCSRRTLSLESFFFLVHEKTVIYYLFSWKRLTKSKFWHVFHLFTSFHKNRDFSVLKIIRNPQSYIEPLSVPPAMRTQFSSAEVGTWLGNRSATHRLAHQSLIGDHFFFFKFPLLWTTRN